MGDYCDRCGNYVPLGESCCGNSLFLKLLKTARTTALPGERKEGV